MKFKPGDRVLVRVNIDGEVVQTNGVIDRRVGGVADLVYRVTAPGFIAIYASEDELALADLDDAGEVNRLRQDNADLKAMVVRLSEDAAVWQRLHDWRAADKRRIVNVDSIWRNEAGPIWSVDLYPGLSQVVSRTSLPGERESAYFDGRKFVGSETHNATLTETVRAALDLYDVLFPARREGEPC